MKKITITKIMDMFRAKDFIRILPGRLDHTYDFEGRCTQCGKNLPLYLKKISQRKIVLRIKPCKKHRQDSYILWPQRDDVIVEE